MQIAQNPKKRSKKAENEQKRGKTGKKEKSEQKKKTGKRRKIKSKERAKTNGCADVACGARGGAGGDT